jgi:translation initiation factor 4E
MSPTSTDSSTAAPPSTTIKKSSGARPPSLNQLAARLNATVANAPAPRPSRLAAFALRTGSNTSLSTNDSISVNASSTRAASPSGGSSTNTASLRSENATPENNTGGEPLTTEKLKEFNETAEVDTVKVPEALLKIPEVPRRKVGYKNIPSLDAISARLAKARSLSVDGSAMPPEPQMIEDPKTPGLVMKAPEHPLQFSWCVDICHRNKEMYADTLIFNVGLYTMIRKGNIPSPLLPVTRLINPYLVPNPNLLSLHHTLRKAQNTKLG